MGNYKGEAIGSNKHYSFSIVDGPCSTTVHLFESAIDLMSYAAEVWTNRPLIFSDTANKEQPFDLVFRNESGGLLSYRTVYDCFK